MNYLRVGFILVIIVLASSLLFSPVTAKESEYVVRGSENLESNYEVKESYEFNGKDYYVVNINGVSTLDLTSNKDIIQNNIVQSHNSRIDFEQRSFNYNIRMIDAASIPSKELYKNKIDVAVLDTGISNHKNLDSVKWEKSLVSSNPNDSNGHGTHTSGIIASTYNSSSDVRGVAPEVDIYNIKVLGNNGRGDLSDTARGIRKAAEGPDGIIGTEDDADVISMSLGSRSGFLIKDAVEEVTPGSVIVASAGNTGNIQYPAKFDETISVASVDKNRDPSFFNSEGPENTVAAPGSYIKSLDNDGGFVEMSGTSMAAPHVSGAVALYLSKFNANSTEVKGKLEETAIDINEEGFDEATGYGLLNVQKLLNRAPKPEIPSVSPPGGSKITPGKEINVSFLDKGAKANLYYSIESEERNQFKLANGSSFEIRESLIGENETSKEIIVELKLKTKGGVDTRKLVYTLVNREFSDVKIEKFGLINSRNPLSYSKNKVKTQISNRGNKDFRLEAQVTNRKTEEVLYEIDKRIPANSNVESIEDIIVKDKEIHLSLNSKNTNLTKKMEIVPRNSYKKVELHSFGLVGSTGLSERKKEIGFVVDNEAEKNVSINGYLSSGYMEKEFSTKIERGRKGFVSKNLTIPEGEGEVKLVSESLGKRFTIIPVRSSVERDFRITDIKIRDSRLRVGDTSELSIYVENEEDSQDAFVADVLINSNKKKTLKSVIPPKETKQITTNLKLEKSGVNILWVRPEDEKEKTKQKTITVYPEKRGDFDVDNVSVKSIGEGDDLRVGKKVLIEAELRNTVSKPGVFLGNLRVGEKIVKKFETKVSSDGKKKIRANFTPESEGKRRVSFISEGSERLGSEKINILPSKPLSVELIRIPNSESLSTEEEFNLMIDINNPNSVEKSLSGQIFLNQERKEEFNYTAPPNSLTTISKKLRIRNTGNKYIGISLKGTEKEWYEKRIKLESNSQEN